MAILLWIKGLASGAPPVQDRAAAIDGKLMRGANVGQQCVGLVTFQVKHLTAKQTFEVKMVVAVCVGGVLIDVNGIAVGCDVLKAA